MTDLRPSIVAGVDTHKDTHTVAALDSAGRLLGHATFAATPAGYHDLTSWLHQHGQVTTIGVEGTGSYGAGLTRHLHTLGLSVVEVNTTDRRARRRRGKSDALDAEAAARAVLAGTATAAPKTRTGPVESLRVLRLARLSAVKAHTAAITALKALIITAPEPLRTQLRALTGKQLITTCAALRPGPDLTNPLHATKQALRHYARRCQHLADEIADTTNELTTLTQQLAPDLLAVTGIGPDTAAQLLITAGDNPHRIHTNAAFAALCGTSPQPASSGRTNRHRLNRGGDRQANAALYRVILTRLRWHQPTRDYHARRQTEGLTTREIIRCLKRYLTRELLPLIKAALAPPTPLANP